MKQSPHFDDALLRRYVAGRASPVEAQAIETAAGRDDDLAERLQALDPMAGLLAPAADALLAAAPADRMQMQLARLQERRTRMRWQRAGGLAAAAVAAGLVVAVGLTGLQRPALPAAETAAAAPMPWSEAVGAYVRLMTPETFRAAPMTAAQLASAMAGASAATGRDLQAIAAALPDMTLARVDLLRLGGRPLVQLGFLDGEGRVVAVCVLARAAPPPAPAGLRQGRAFDLDFLTWDQGATGLLVIGAAPPEVLGGIARRLGAPT